MGKIIRIYLIEERKRRQWSQREVADLLGTTQNNVSRWELGITTPSSYFRARLCELFGKRPDELGLLANQSGETQLPSSISDSPTLPATSDHLPSLWHVPYLRNPFFTGREAFLEHLHTMLQKKRTMALTQPLAISGLGGIGKTQIALEYAYQHRKDYRFIFWISAATRETLLSELITLADRLQLSPKDQLEPGKIVQIVKHWLAFQHEWLLILDNADDITVMQDIMPTEHTGHLLLTSRAQALGSLAQRLEVEEMGIVEGLLFLLRRAKLLAPDADLDHVPENQLAAAEAIVIEMTSLPLALDQAGAYIDEVGCSLADYLDLYHAHRKELLQRRGHVPTEHPASVATTWSLNFQQVRQANPVAADLLRLCAFLEPDAIPEELLHTGKASQGEAFQPVAADIYTFNEAIEELRKFSLVYRDPQAKLLRLHRLTQAVLRDIMAVEEQRSWAKRAVKVTHALFLETGDAVTQDRYQRYLPQAQACSLLIQDYAFDFSEATALLMRTADYVYTYALYEQAEKLYQRVLAMRELTLEPKHLDIASVLHALAKVAKVLRKFEQAEALCRRALHIREQVLAPNHHDITDSLIELARIHLALGEYVRAEELYQRVLDIREQTLEPKHVDVAMALNELGRIFYWQGKYSEAEPLCQRAVSIWEQTLGPNHPNVASALNLLAIFAERQNRYEQAESLYLRALHIREQTWGAEHYDVAGSLNNLADLSTKQGKYEQAEAFYQRAVAIWEKALGADHPNVGYGIYGLADLYMKQEKYEQARLLYQQALSLWEKSWGPEHPDVATGLHGLANLYSKLGMEQAGPLYQRALAIREQTLGSDHPEMLQVRQDFAAFQDAQHASPSLKSG